METWAKYGATGDTVAKRIATLAITEDLNEGVGWSLAAIDRLGIADNTIVFFMAENGGFLTPSMVVASPELLCPVAAATSGVGGKNSSSTSPTLRAATGRSRPFGWAT